MIDKTVLKFYKYQGAGNDFVLINNMNGEISLNSKQIENICNRNFGIGADGLMMLEKDTNNDFYMRYFNADSSEVAMCGNGGRCIVLFAHHQGVIGKNTTFNSLDGIHSAQIINDNGIEGHVKINLINVNEIVEYNNDIFMNTGVPHYIQFVDNVDHVDIQKEGSFIRYNEMFKPEGTNVNFVEISGIGAIKVRTYERGVEGETLACGTGATAAAIATSLKFQPSINSFKVSVQGGELNIDFNKLSSHNYINIQLEGGAKATFKGEFILGGF